MNTNKVLTDAVVELTTMIGTLAEAITRLNGRVTAIERDKIGDRKDA